MLCLPITVPVFWSVKQKAEITEIWQKKKVDTTEFCERDTGESRRLTRPLVVFSRPLENIHIAFVWSNADLHVTHVMR